MVIEVVAKRPEFIIGSIFQVTLISDTTALLSHKYLVRKMERDASLDDGTQDLGPLDRREPVGLTVWTRFPVPPCKCYSPRSAACRALLAWEA